MKSLLIIAFFAFFAVSPSTAQERTVREINGYTVHFTNDLTDNRLWGWIELDSPDGRKGGAGYIYLHPAGERLDAPSLGGDEPRYIVMHAPIDQLPLLREALAAAAQIRIESGSVFLEPTWAGGTAPNDAGAVPLRRSQSLSVGPPMVELEATPIQFANWNIQTLTLPGERVFSTQKPEDLRTEADFVRLRLVRDAIGADVFALQEISSLRALAKIFPTSEWQLCMSGQYDADAGGLAPDYDSDDIAGIVPTCVVDADDANLPDLAAGVMRKQYVALAIRTASGVTLRSIRDVPSLAVSAEDKDADGSIVVRSVRWGLEAVLGTPGGSFKVLDVHLKSGCPDGFLQAKWWRDLETWSPDNNRDHPCDTLARQLPALKSWIADAEAAEVPFVIVGDFNRRLDNEATDSKTPDMLPVLNGSATPSDAADDVALTYIPEGPFSVKSCWPEDENTDFRHSIEFMLFGPGDRPQDWQSTYNKLRYVDLTSIGGTTLNQDADSPHLSDHCPSVVSIR